jgi:hypothetical protein
MSLRRVDSRAWNGQAKADRGIEFVLTKNSNKKKDPPGRTRPWLQVEDFVLANYGARRQTGDL